MNFQPVGQGKRSRIAEVGGLRLTESWHPPHAQLDWHAHLRGCITLLLSGGMRESFRSSEADCRQGGMLIKPPGADHCSRFGPQGARCVIVEIVEGRPLELGSALFGNVAYRPIDSGFTRRMSLELATPDAASDIVLEGLALQLLGLAVRSDSAGVRSDTGLAPWLSAVHDRIESDFRSQLSITELANLAGVHPDHLSRTFRRRFGCSIGGMIRELRLSWAAEQLARTDRELSTIALDAGYCDQSHFTRAFRRRFGLTPGSFRSERAT